MGNPRHSTQMCQIALTLKGKCAVITDNLHLRDAVMKETDEQMWELTFRDGKDVVRLYKRSTSFKTNKKSLPLEFRSLSKEQSDSFTLAINW